MRSQTIRSIQYLVSCIAMFGAVIGWSSPGSAYVQQLVIDGTNTANYNPIPLGSSTPGPSVSYTIYTGRIFGLLNPSNPLNTVITDLSNASSVGGSYSYIAQFSILTPTNPAQRNGLMIQEVPNRGGNAISTTALIAGATYVQSGWQGDLLSQCSTAPVPAYPCVSLTSTYGSPSASYPFFTGPTGLAAFVLQVPVATTDGNAPNGTNTLTGQVYGHVCTGPNGCPLAAGSPPTSTSHMAIQGPAFVPYQPVSTDTNQAQMWTVSSQTFSGVDSAKTAIPSADWAWAYCPSGWPGTPNPTYICLRNGTFNPNLLYEVTYTAANPLVLGVGFAAFRDLGSFLKYGTTAPGGGSNPIAGSITTTMTVGASQSAAFIHGLIFYGFNEDEDGRIVFDGAWPQIDGRMMVMNIRWGQPNNLMYLYMGGDEAPVWWADYPNLARNLPANGMLHRCSATGTCPQILETFASAELYSEKMAVSLCGFTCVADVPLPSNVFRYYTPSATHGGGTVSFTWSAPGSITPPTGQTYPSDPVPETYTNNALQSAFINWLLNGIAMPPSVYPTLAKGELVLNTQSAEGFPNIPGFPFAGNQAWPPFTYDFGPGENYDQESGIPTIQPPNITQVLPVYATKVNADGNENVTGLPTVLGQAPLGTYVGWNLTSLGWYTGQVIPGAGGSGAFWPFWDTKAHRTAANDPRLSLEERYGTHQGYSCTVRVAANQAMAARFLLSSDAPGLMTLASSGNVLTSPFTPTVADTSIANTYCGVVTTHDFTGDSYSDILWEDIGGDLAVWQMHGATIQQGISLGAVPSTWSVVGSRDFNHDGVADILWRDTSGNVTVWLMSNGAVLSSGGAGNMPTNWSVAGTGNFGGNGNGGVLWRNTAGDLQMWLMNGTAVSQTISIGNVSPTLWLVAGVGDFNGDGTSDILWQDVGGDVTVWMMGNRGSITQGVSLGSVPPGWSVAGTGDFNNDGYSDILWRNTAGDIMIWLINNGALQQQLVLGNLPTSWSVAETGDFNNDGNSDIVWIDTSGNVMIWYMNGVNVTSAISLGNVTTAWAIQGANAD